MLLALLGLLYLLLVQLLLTPLGAVGRPLASLLTAVLARAALGVLGYFWIRTETVSAKRGMRGVKQAIPSVKRGDLIIANWTSPVDVLYYAFRWVPLPQSLAPVSRRRPSFPSTFPAPLRAYPPLLS